MRRTAALILIGNEILSGRTRDDNIQFLATNLGELGIPLREIRVIPDVRETIVKTVVELRARYDEVFTTGGIGPTHDDITGPCVAEAFGVPWEFHRPTFDMLQEQFGADFNAARQRMAKLPRGAVPIPNPVSRAPGYSIGNVHVMAGVPRIMRAMFNELAPSLKRGAPVFSRTWYTTSLFEGTIADGLEAIQTQFPDLDIGSYPFHRDDGRRGVALVAKGQDVPDLEKAAQAIHDLIKEKGGVPVEGEPPP
ncbi:competence-damage protein [Acetobacter indonesiensis NRIC 0313]|uniref:Competence-damage protein n=1 Tax=Acetobacter indonesiensis TaxID=104101 RepID=A0A6N3SZQ8_9PROT|nr:molybdopterin-binding protein [Acetobacter indonesiensis]GAN62797.1 competence-damage protein [Acetobacter indonesiensis]GBQ54538.1 competence-damage protein [Acetobacter indonesiensis NRIC 0313]GEN02366.1 molybdenum cofactor biosynthesis protein [Acetobacter indonesiensis]